MKTARFKKFEIVFWVIYLALPMVTGWLDYQSLPNEHYDPSRHEILRSHAKEAWPEGLGTYQIPDVWKDQATGTVYTFESFSEHHRSEAKRLGLMWFAYGLIGCVFFAYCCFVKERGSFISAFMKGSAIDLVVALIVFWLA